jgi:hypothetical protein
MLDDDKPTLGAPADDTDVEEEEEEIQPVDPEEDEEEEQPLPGELTFCELCGTGEDDDDELLRCEECGRLICSACREYDDEDTPYCTDCYDDVVES